MRALVTGGAGFVGSHIVDLLLARGDQVSVLDNLDPRVHGDDDVTLSQEVRFVRGDLLSPVSLEDALKGGVDLVFHEAAMVGFGRDAVDAEAYVSNNVIGTIRLMEAIAKLCSRPPRFILASSMAIYGEGAYECKNCGSSKNIRRNPEDLEKHNWEPLCPKCGNPLEPRPLTGDHSPAPGNVYAVSKLNQELLSMTLGRHYRIPVVALRYHNVYGPRMPRDTPYAGVASIFKSKLLARRPPIIYEDGGQLRDFIHVEDVARANLLAADAPEDTVEFHAFNVGTGQPHQIVELALQLEKSLGLDIQPQFPGLFRLGDVRHIFACTSKIERIGFRPRISFEEGMKRFALEPTRSPPKVMLSS